MDRSARDRLRAPHLIRPPLRLEGMVIRDRRRAKIPDYRTHRIVGRAADPAPPYRPGALPEVDDGTAWPLLRRPRDWARIAAYAAVAVTSSFLWYGGLWLVHRGLHRIAPWIFE